MKSGFEIECEAQVQVRWFSIGLQFSPAMEPSVLSAHSSSSYSYPPAFWRINPSNAHLLAQKCNFTNYPTLVFSWKS
jgi:hypothetical protein